MEGLRLRLKLRLRWLLQLCVREQEAQKNLRKLQKRKGDFLRRHIQSAPSKAQAPARSFSGVPWRRDSVFPAGKMTPKFLQWKRSP